MRKYCLLTFALSFIITSSLFAQASGDSVAFCSGERLRYVIHYKCLGIRTDVGEGSVQLSDIGVLNGRGVFQTSVFGNTYKFWDAFFKVREHFESKFYADSIRPLYFFRDTHEGRYKIKNTYYWNDETNGIYARVERVKEEPLDTLLPGQKNTFDLLTMFYYLRNFDFDKIEQGTNQPLSFAIDEEIFNIYFRLIGREVKKVYSLGEWNTLKFAVKVVAGEVFTGKTELFIWVTDDQNKIPLLFEVPIIVGTMSGRLVEYNNTKHPMNCQIKAVSL